jgi:hypothetical protein
MTLFRKWTLATSTLLIVILLAFQWASTLQAAAVTALRVSCGSTRVRGVTEVAAPYVRVTVSLASDLSVQLAERTVSVSNRIGARYDTTLNYTQQPEGTRLIISVGEWDGQQYLRPATLMAQNCGRNGRVTPTFIPSPTFVPSPTPTALPGTISQTWSISQTLIQDTCGIAGPDNTFQATLVFTSDGRLVALSALTITYPMSLAGEGLYFARMEFDYPVHELTLQFNSPSTFAANLVITIPSIPGCSTLYNWSGTVGYLPATAIPTLPLATPTMPPLPSPTFTALQTYNVTSTLVQDTCGGASTGASFPVTLSFVGEILAAVNWFDTVFPMNLLAGNAYYGEAHLSDATYALQLWLTTPGGFDATLRVYFGTQPGCLWECTWVGSRIS